MTDAHREDPRGYVRGKVRIAPTEDDRERGDSVRFDLEGPPVKMRVVVMEVRVSEN